MAIPRMRTAERVLDEIKALDPETEMTLHHVRQLIREEAVPVVRCGRKKLVNVDAVLELLAGGHISKKETPVQMTGEIRRIEV